MLQIPVDSLSSEEWTCKKCTLLNNSTATVCVVCGGSKLKSISNFEDEKTLRKGEFWSCSQCTLKNSLSIQTCIACKCQRQMLNLNRPQLNFKPYTTSSSSTSSATSPLTSSNYNQQNQNNLKPTIVEHQSKPVTTALAPTLTTSSTLSSNSLALPVNRVSRSPSPRNERVASGAVPKVL